MSNNYKALMCLIKLCAKESAADPTWRAPGANIRLLLRVTLLDPEKDLVPIHVKDAVAVFD